MAAPPTPRPNLLRRNGEVPMLRNLIICCDGTNNSLKSPPTNVCHLSKLADIADETLQRVFYDAGVGVDADPDMHTRIGAVFSRWSGSAFGTGLVGNVEDAYRELIEQYNDGDRVFLFGFSRGAYTVRVIAGLLHNYGLLRKENASEAHAVVKAFQDLYPPKGSGFVNGVPTTEQQARFDEARRIRNMRSVPCPIHFMGVFDTVSSLGWAWDPKSFPNTMTMPNVTILRHALALDERRAKFRTNRILMSENADHRQMWFAGVHSDVGGGYKAPRNQLSRVPLRWMLGEALKAGMLVNNEVLAELNLDATWMQDEQADQNESLTMAWRALEFLPLPHWEKKDDVWVEGKRVYRGQGWREIPDTYDAHDSLQRRKKAVKNVYWEKTLPSINYRA
jgi:uncharacterized protein (DUF2235 family)